MAVPTWKQTASKLDAFAEAVKLRHIITQMIMRNFGLKRGKYDAAKKCMQGVMWKYSTQAYYLDRIERIRITKERLERRDRMSDGFVQFTVCERGKRRDIRSIHINERVVHRAENDLILRN